MNSIPIFLIALSALLVACNSEDSKPITVVVFPGGDQCEIQTRAVPCADAGQYLSATLKASATRQINVSMHPSNKDDKGIDRVADTIKQSGFTDVRVWRFGFN